MSAGSNGGPQRTALDLTLILVLLYNFLCLVVDLRCEVEADVAVVLRQLIPAPRSVPPRPTREPAKGMAAGALQGTHMVTSGTFGDSCRVTVGESGVALVKKFK